MKCLSEVTDKLKNGFLIPSARTDIQFAPILFMERNLKRIVELLLAITLILSSILSAEAQSTALRTQQNVMVEATFEAKNTYDDPFNQVTLDVQFVEPSGKQLQVPAFWAGTNVWKVRYASAEPGVHKFRTECSAKTDPGLHGIEGHIEVQPYTGTNPLYLHGPLKLSSNRRFMEHRDGTPFFWLGDTWWMGLTHRLGWPEDFQTLAADRKVKGFNVIQIVAGLYPDMHPFDPRGANEAGQPWETNYARIRPEYFNAADRRFQYLVDQGFTPCIVGAWGYFIPWMGVEKARQHWRNLVARYGALPVVWCVAGEANLPWYLAKGFPYDERQQVKHWTEVARYLREADPFDRLITIHPTGIGRLSSRNVINDLSLIDFDMLQTPHGQHDAVAPTVQTVRDSYSDKPVMPVINGEASYEMLSDTLPTEWTRRMFWLSVMNGAPGHTYGANGIWQVNRPGRPHGPSPHHTSADGYGKIPWQEAMHLPGSGQVALGKRLMEQFPWQEFIPHPEWSAFAEVALLSLDDAQWIWFPEGAPAKDAPPGKRFFRRGFSLPEGKIKSAQLRVSADDQFNVSLNGEYVGSSNPGPESWRAGKQFDDFIKLLKPGTNCIAISAENMPAPGANPAGLMVALEIQFDEGSSIEIISDGKWRSSKDDFAGWEQVQFDDKSWQHALAVGKYGDSPWGRIGEINKSPLHGPQSVGIEDGVRLVYVPERREIVLNHLAAKANYSVYYFDPITGASSAPSIIKANERGSWTCPAPAGLGSDWLIVVTPGDKAE